MIASCGRVADCAGGRVVISTSLMTGKYVPPQRWEHSSLQWVMSSKQGSSKVARLGNILPRALSRQHGARNGVLGMRFEAEILSHDLHALLGVPTGATADQIRSAYRQRARTSHPDLNPGDPDAGRRMALLNRAVRVLLDPAQRRDYERARRKFSGAAHERAAKNWFDQREFADVEWRRPDVRPASPSTPGQRAFRRRVRHAGASVASLAEDALRRLGNDQRLMLAALCIALGSGLLVFAHPSNAFWTRSEAAQVGVTEP